MTKLVARTELLQLFRGVMPNELDAYGLTGIFFKLRNGVALTAEEAIHASKQYHHVSSLAGGQRTASAAELHGRNTSALGPGIQGGGGEEVLPEAQRVGSELLAGGEQLEDAESLENGGSWPTPANDNPTAAEPPRIIGAFRLATNTGFVVFVASTGVSGRVEIRCGQGLGLPGDLDLVRVLEHGALIELDQLRGYLNVPE